MSDKKFYETVCKTQEYKNKVKNLQTENQQLKSTLEEIRKYIKDKIYNIEPKGTGINYNCEYDSEEDFISAMEEKSRLNTLKELLQIIDKGETNEIL